MKLKVKCIDGLTRCDIEHFREIGVFNMKSEKIFLVKFTDREQQILFTNMVRINRELKGNDARKTAGVFCEELTPEELELMKEYMNFIEVSK